MCRTGADTPFKSKAWIETRRKFLLKEKEFTRLREEGEREPLWACASTASRPVANEEAAQQLPFALSLSKGERIRYRFCNGVARSCFDKLSTNGVFHFRVALTRFARRRP
jgi:hypothetical protein